MSVYNTPDPLPASVPPAVAGGEGEAERYIASELKRERVSLRWTQGVCAALVLGTLLYMGFITARIRESLEPKAAAEIASGLVGERVSGQAEAFSEQIKQRVPALIAGLPDYALKQMPLYRQRLEDQAEEDLSRELQAHSASSGEAIDNFLNTHQEEMKALLTDGKDRKISQAMGDDLEKQMLSFLKETPLNGGETAQGKLDTSLKMLKQVEAKMNRLASGANLTPQEKKTRRAIAVLSEKVETQRAAKQASAGA